MCLSLKENKDSLDLMPSYSDDFSLRIVIQ